MSKISNSPNRISFQKSNYIKRQLEKGETVNQSYLDLFDTLTDRHNNRFDDPENRLNNLEYDFLTTDWILKKVRTSDQYAQNLYAALCNNNFIKHNVIQILKEQYWSCSWRYAGGIIADMKQKGDYIDWYCSGMGGLSTYDESGQEDMDKKKYVAESIVTDEIREDLLKLGWSVVDNSDN